MNTGSSTNEIGSAEAVAVHDRTVTVQWLVLSDSDTVNAARAAAAAGHDLADWLRTCVRSGAIAAQAAASGMDLATIERSLTDLVTQTGRHVDEHLGQLAAVIENATGPNGPMARVAVEQVNRLATGVGALLTGPDATVPARLSQAVTQAAQQTLADLRRDLAMQAQTLSATVGQDREALHRAITAQTESDQAHIRHALSEIRAGLTAISTHQAAEDAAKRATQAAPAASSGPGRSYEEAAADAIARVAGLAGFGGATHVGDTTGLDGSRVGDVIVALNDRGPNQVLVFEAKARQEYSSAKAKAELARARSNRGAAYGILLTPRAMAPVKDLALLWLTGTDLAITWDVDDPVSDAVLAGAMHLLAGLASRTAPAGGAIDIAGLQLSAEGLLAALEPFTAIFRSIGSAENALARLRATATSLHDDVMARAQSMRDQLA